jgi:hypothetical protein
VSLTTSQARALLRKINKGNTDFWKADGEQLARLTEQFKQLKEKYPDAHAQRIMEAARLIVDQHTLKTGKPSHAAAVLAAEAIEALQGQQRETSRKQNNDRREIEADNQVRGAFHAWEKRLSTPLAGKDRA